MRRRAARDQRGATLVEVLLASGISAVIAGPLLLWGMFAIGQQQRSGDSLSATNGAALLESYFTRDVTRSADVQVSGTDCGGSQTAGATVHVVLVGGVAERVTRSYVESDGVADDGTATRSLWRRDCSPSGSLLSETQLVEHVRSGTTSVSCMPASGPQACRQVELRTTPVGTDEPVVARATRRVDALSAAAGPTNRPPRAVVAAEAPSANPPSGNYPLTVTFTGAGSSDPDGTVSTYDWEFPEAAPILDGGVRQTWTFAEPGRFPVLLTVTDDGGLSRTDYVTAVVTNRPPVAQASVDLASGTIGTAFNFSAVGSTDPEEGLAGLTYQWDFGDGPVVRTSDQTVTHVFQPGAVLGSRDVTLTVFDKWAGTPADPDGGSGTDTVRLTLDDRAPVVSAVTFSPARAPTTNVVKLPVTFSATATDPDAIGVTPSAWEWKVSYGGIDVWTATTASPTLSTAPNGVGTYQVRARAKVGDLWSEFTPPETFVVAPSKPAAPTWNKNAMPGTINWTAVAGAQSYTIRVNQPGEPCHRIVTVPAGTTSYRYTPDCFNWWFDAWVAVTVNGVTSDWSDVTRRL